MPRINYKIYWSHLKGTKFEAKEQYTAKMATLIASFTSLTVSTTIIKTSSANTARKLVTSVRKDAMINFPIVTQLSIDAKTNSLAGQ